MTGCHNDLIGPDHNVVSALKVEKYLPHDQQTRDVVVDLHKAIWVHRGICCRRGTTKFTIAMVSHLAAEAANLGAWSVCLHLPAVQADFLELPD